MDLEERRTIKTCFHCKGEGVEMSDVIRYCSDMFIKDKVEKHCTICLGEGYIIVLEDGIKRKI